MNGVMSGRTPALTGSLTSKDRLRRTNNNEILKEELDQHVQAIVDNMHLPENPYNYQKLQKSEFWCDPSHPIDCLCGTYLTNIPMEPDLRAIPDNNLLAPPKLSIGVKKSGPTKKISFAAYAELKKKGASTNGTATNSPTTISPAAGSPIAQPPAVAAISKG